jgi:hypothetical protein
VRSPFLTVVTRCYKRPAMLQINMASLDAQTDKGIEQIFIIDRVGRGIVWANQQLYAHRNRARGRYVYILDDDNRLVDKDLVAELRRAAMLWRDPDVFVVKGLRPTSNVRVFPDDQAWRTNTLRKATTNAHCYVVKANVWKMHIKSFGYPPTLSGAWQFPKALIDHGGYRWVWRNIVAGESIWLGRGRTETDSKAWWQAVLRDNPDIEMHGSPDFFSTLYRRRLWLS